MLDKDCNVYFCMLLDTFFQKFEAIGIIGPECTNEQKQPRLNPASKFATGKANFNQTWNKITLLTNCLLCDCLIVPASVAQLDAPSDWRQEVAGSTPDEVGNILSWRLIMKYFLRSFSPFR